MAFTTTTTTYQKNPGISLATVDRLQPLASWGGPRTKGRACHLEGPAASRALPTWPPRAPFLAKVVFVVKWRPQRIGDHISDIFPHPKGPVGGDRIFSSQGAKLFVRMCSNLKKGKPYDSLPAPLTFFLLSADFFASIFTS